MSVRDIRHPRASWVRAFSAVGVPGVLALILVADPLVGLALGAGAGFLGVRMWRTAHGPAPVRPGPLVVALLYIGMLGVLFASSDAPLDGTQSSLVLALAVVCALPVVAWARRPDHSGPLLPLVGLVYALTFGLSLLGRQSLTRASHIGVLLPEGGLTRALLYALAGFLALLVAYWAARSIRLPDGLKAPALNLGASGTRWMGLAVLGILAQLVQSNVDVPLALAQPLELIDSLSLLGIAGLYVRWRQGLHTPLEPLALAGLLGFDALLGFSSGANYQGLEVVLTVGLAELALTRRWRWTFIVLAVVALIIFQPVKSAFRLDVASGGPGGIAGWSSTVGQTWTDGDVVTREVVDDFASRMGYAPTFAEVITLTPAVVPYWGAETFVPVLTKPVPRFLLPSKPLEDLGQEFGHRYAFLARSDTATSYNVPHLIEFYMSFGPIGVLAGMSLLGVLYRVADRYARRGRGPQGAVVYAYLLSPFLLIQSNVSLILPGVAYRILALYVVVHVSPTLRRPTRLMVDAPKPNRANARAIPT